MTLRLRISLLVLAASVIAGCSGGSVILTPSARGPHGGGATAPAATPVASPSASPKPTSSPKPTPSPTPAPTSSSSGALTAAQVNAALTGANAYFATLPHQDVNADLAALAAHMVASHQFSAAAVSYGGITATLSDGEPAVLFADRVPDAQNATYARPAESEARRLDSPLSAANSHEIAFLVNIDYNANSPFHVERQQAFAAGFTASGFTPANKYGVDVQDISLENIVALGTGHPIDFLSLATHGVVAGEKAPFNYLLASATSVTDASKKTFAKDLAAGRIVYSVVLQYPVNTGETAEFAFSMDFLTSHLKFNAGAIVDNGSCFGASPATLATVTAKLGAAGVARYIGWTKRVDGNDADQTDATLFDRMLGEQKPSITGIDKYASQRKPPQRPFSFPDIVTGVILDEARSGPLGAGTGIHAGSLETYDFSNPPITSNSVAPPVSDGTISKWSVTYISKASDALVVPSIATMSVVEAQSGGTLTINGAFPEKPGTVTVTDATGTATYRPLTWTDSAVSVMLPPSGPQSAGMVQVISAGGIGSNLVPLTQWTGVAKYQESDVLSNAANVPGSGNESFTMSFNLTYRADVHPYVATIEEKPVPQNFFFNNVESTSTGAMTALTGTFVSSNDSGTATYSLAANAPISPSYVLADPDLAPLFLFVPLPTAPPAGCNSGAPGTGKNATVFCPFVFWGTKHDVECTGPKAVCPLQFYNSIGAFGPVAIPSGEVYPYSDGPLTLVMNPKTYVVTVNGPPTNFGSPNGFGTGLVPATASMSGSFTPAYAPAASTPALRRL